MAQARLIYKEITESLGWCSLDDKSQNLYILLCIHADDFGRLSGEIDFIRTFFTHTNRKRKLENQWAPEIIEKCLFDITKNTDIIRWQDINGKWNIQCLNWFKWDKRPLKKRTLSRYPEITEETMKSLQRDYQGYLKKREEYAHIGVKQYNFYNQREAENLIQYFIDSLQKNVGKKTKASPKWIQDMDTIMRIDHKNSDDIRKAISYFHTDDFWRSNILSPEKLRKQFFRYELFMNKKTGTGKYRPKTMEEL